MPSYLSDSAGCTTILLRIVDATHEDRLADATRCFQRTGRAPAVLRGDGQRIGAILEAGGQDQQQLGGVVDEDVVGRELDGLALGGGQGDAYRRVVAHHLEARAAHEEAAAGSDGAVLQARVAILDLEDVHHVGLLAQDLDHRLGDGLAQIGPLGEGDVDGIMLGVPLAAHGRSPQLGHGVEEPRVDVVAIEQQLRDHPVIKFDDVEDRLLTESALLLVQQVDDIVEVVGLPRLDDEDLVVLVVRSDCIIGQPSLDHVLCHKFNYLG